MSAFSGVWSEPALLLVNGRSRRGQAAFGAVSEGLRARGITLCEAKLTTRSDETRHLLRREIERGARVVIVGGGDGTLSLCAHELAGSNVALAVLPLGTGNTFARSLAMPLSIGSALDALAAGSIDEIDVGRCNGRVFLNSVSLGLSATIARSLSSEIKASLGVAAWLVAGMRAVMKHRPLRLRVRHDEGENLIWTHQLVIAAGRHVAGPIVVDVNASSRDARLDVVALGRASRLDLMRATTRWVWDGLAVGPANRMGDARHLARAQWACVESLGQPVRANIDGEIVGTTPLEITIEPRALRVVNALSLTD